MTAECLIICIAMWVICATRSFEGMRYGDAQRQWGAAVSLEITSYDDAPDVVHRQLKGPFDLWAGEWWRMPVSAFHHGDLVHLLLNCSAAWMLGRRLEQRWGSLRYALFLVPAIVIPMVAETISGNAAVGFSGAICAMLGALMVLQPQDPQADDLPQEVILFSLGFILMGIPFNALELAPIRVANTAHFTGLAYGGLAAWSCCGPASRFLIVRAAFVVSHVLVLPAIWLATHPIMNGRYLWYLADRDQRVEPDKREALLKLAVEADPSLTALWLRLADYRLAEGKTQAAWTVIMEGLLQNPTDTDLFDAARAVWRRFPQGAERETAEAELKRVFGDQADAWSRQIRNTRLVAKGPRKSEPRTPELDPKEFPLNQSIDLQWEPKPRVEPKPPVLDPDQPNSASEGTTL